MQFSLAAVLSTLAILAGVCVAQTVVPDHGTTSQPADGAVIAPGDNFPFSFTPAPFGTQVCFSAYDGVSIYLSTSPPTAADVTSNGPNSCNLASGSFVNDFGSYVVPHFSGLPPVGPGFPPATFTMPTLNVADDTTLYLSVLETFSDCKAGGTVYFCGIETTTVVSPELEQPLLY